MDPTLARAELEPRLALLGDHRRMWGALKNEVSYRIEIAEQLMAEPDRADEDHWLTYGASDRAAVMVRANDALIARDPVRTIGRYAAPGDIHLGGLLWPEAVGRLAMTAFLTVEGRGRGQVILFADDPNFRGYFWGTERLFLNAVLLGPGVGTRRSIPW